MKSETPSKLPFRYRVLQAVGYFLIALGTVLVGATGVDIGLDMPRKARPEDVRENG